MDVYVLGWNFLIATYQEELYQRPYWASVSAEAWTGIEENLLQTKQ